MSTKQAINGTETNQQRKTASRPVDADVRREYVDDLTSSGYARVTCRACGRSVVCQPHMLERQWKHERMRFMQRHRCDSAERLR